MNRSEEELEMLKEDKTNTIRYFIYRFSNIIVHFFMYRYYDVLLHNVDDKLSELKQSMKSQYDRGCVAIPWLTNHVEKLKLLSFKAKNAFGPVIGDVSAGHDIHLNLTEYDHSDSTSEYEDDESDLDFVD